MEQRAKVNGKEWPPSGRPPRDWRGRFCYFYYFYCCWCSCDGQNNEVLIRTGDPGCDFSLWPVVFRLVPASPSDSRVREKNKKIIKNESKWTLLTEKKHRKHRVTPSETDRGHTATAWTTHARALIKITSSIFIVVHVGGGKLSVRVCICVFSLHNDIAIEAGRTDEEQRTR